MRNNCSGQWERWVRCPDHTVAAAVRLHHKALGGRRAFTGISLKCHRTESRIRDDETNQVLDTVTGNPPGGKEPPAFERLIIPDRPTKVRSR